MLIKMHNFLSYDYANSLINSLPHSLISYICSYYIIKMKQPTLLNCSLRKTFEFVPDSLDQAKIKIFIFIFLLNIFKIGIALPKYIADAQQQMLFRSIAGIVISISIIKLLLSRPKWINFLIHISVLATIFLVFGRIMLYGNYTIDIAVLQQVFMIMTFSFYGLGRKGGMFYSVLSVIPVVIALVVNQHHEVLNTVPDIFTDATYIIIIVLNFVSIGISHYLFYGAFDDTINEKKQLNHILRKTAKGKSDFLSMMSHELRTPLNSVIGMTNLLLSGKTDQEQKENLDILKFSAENLLSLINNVLDFNKIDSDSVTLERREFNLYNLIQNVHSGFRLRANQKKLDFIVFHDPEINNFNIVSDSTRLLQIFTNLIENAIKFTESGFVEVSTSLLRYENKMARVRFCVKDSGIGISSEKRELIFDPFVQASESTTRYFGGTGLGLPIVKQLLRHFDSEIYMESTAGIGTSFYFEIDFETINLNAMDNTDKRAVEDIDIGNIRILLAEDNAINVLLMKKLFAKWDLNIAVAANGKEAIDMLAENQYDVLLMDINMPVMDGLEATRHIRKLQGRQSKIHIIALTAEVSPEMENEIKKAGMDDYMTKPFVPDELKAKINKRCRNVDSELVNA
ncbi:MAG TPA: response regulator [Flavobacterium sp.]|nr:response regulator [Flavobacterium sp.]